MATVSMLVKPVASVSRAALPAKVRSAPLVAHRLSRPSRGLRVIVKSTDRDTVLADVRQIISEQLGKDLDAVSADSKFVDLGADSLDTVEIMMALEEKFDLQLDEEGAEKISTVQEAADLISTQIDAA